MQYISLIKSFIKIICFSTVFSIAGYGQTTPSGFETVFYEGFDYPSGQDLYYQSGGIGFTSNWKQSYLNKYLSVQSSGWTYPNLQTTGLRAGYDSTCYGTCNDISSSGRDIPSQSSGVLYLQFLANFGTQRGGGTPHLRLYNGSNLKVAVGAISTSNWQLVNIDSNITASTTSSVSVLKLVVVRFDYDNGNIKIWTDPNLATFDYSNAPTPSAEINSITTPSFNRLELYFRSNGIPGIDEIHAFKSISRPIITGPNSETGLTSAVSINENSTAVHTFSSNETVTWSLGSSNDEALFGMDSNGNLVFTNTPDYETPSSTASSNTYVVEVIATDSANNSTKQTLTITVLDIPNTKFGTFAAINKQYFVGTYTIVPPTTNNTNPIVYTSDNSAVATISGSVITFTDVGTANITATQAADANYEGNTVSAVLTVLGKDLVSKYGGISSTDVIFVDANGKIGGDFGVDKYGNIQNVYEALVTSGLIMHLDAGNTASYPGTGTIWSDLSGNANHGTLINGVAYTSANNGALIFDGVIDSFSTTLSPGDANTSFSWGGFVKVNAPTSQNYFIFGNYTQNGTTPFFAIAFNNSGDNTFIYMRSSTNSTSIGSSTNLDLNTWYYLMGVRDAGEDQIKLYVNGELIVTDTFLGSYDVKSTSNNFGGVNHLSNYINCNIGQVQFYNRALATEEIQQNYNAVKSRYGL